MLKISVGIDVSKEKLSVCIQKCETGGVAQSVFGKEYDNDKNGFAALSHRVKKHTPKNRADVKIIFVMEATGVYYEQLAYFLCDNGHSVSVQLANKVKNFAKSLNVKTKNDAVDARVISQMGIERELRLWQGAKPVWRTLRTLTRERETLNEERSVVINQLEAVRSSYEPDARTMSRMEARIKLLDEQIAAAEKDLHETVKKHPAIEEKIKKVCTIKGVQFLTAVTVVAECAGFELFENKAQLVSYAGYDVVENQSGNHKGKTRISKKGNAHIRRAMHYPALSAKRYEPSFKKYADRITEKTKIPMKGAVAIQRKLLCLIFKLYKTDGVYDENHEADKARKRELESGEKEQEKLVAQTG